MKNSRTHASPLICNLSALDQAARERHQINTSQLFGAVEAIEELPAGYAFRLPAESATILQAAEFITLERLCCPFFDFFGLSSLMCKQKTLPSVVGLNFWPKTAPKLS